MILRSYRRFALLALTLVLGTLAVAPDAHAAKLIENGWNAPKSPAQMRDVVAPSEYRLALDGTILRLVPNKWVWDKFLPAPLARDWRIVQRVVSAPLVFLPLKFAFLAAYEPPLAFYPWCFFATY